MIGDTGDVPREIWLRGRPIRWRFLPSDPK
jgi:hypothetical protein